MHFDIALVSLTRKNTSQTGGEAALVAAKQQCPNRLARKCWLGNEGSLQKAQGSAGLGGGFRTRTSGRRSAVRSRVLSHQRPGAHRRRNLAVNDFTFVLFHFSRASVLYSVSQFMCRVAL